MTVAATTLILLAAACPCFGQEKANIPYEKLYRIFKRAAGVNNKAVRAVVALVPKSSEVNLREMTFIIHAKTGAQKVMLDPDGEIRDFPMSEALLTENPPVESNQPKGSMSIGGGIAIVLPEGTTFTYRQLSDLLDAANAEIKKQAGLLSFIAPQPKAIVFEFFDGRTQSLTVGTNSSTTTLRTDAKGHISLTIDKALVAQNAVVTLSERPAKAVVDL